jgi:hypothetical protein
LHAAANHRSTLHVRIASHGCRLNWASQHHRWRHARNPRHAYSPLGHRRPREQPALPRRRQLTHRCGANSANDLDAFIARRPVSCQARDLDRYGRTVATCLVGEIDAGEWLVRNGFALDWPRYSKGRYGDAQRDAEHAGRGIWAGSYVEPWLYRACIRAGGKPDNCSDNASGRP